MSMAFVPRRRYITLSMKNRATVWICAGGCIALALVARAAKTPGDDHAVGSDNPYGAIVERNIFDLHDPPPPAVDDKKDKGPPPNIKLTGITTIFGAKQALFILNKPGAAGKPPSTQSLILSEGQRSGDLEVLEINPKGRLARIKLDDVESTLNIETNKGAITQQAGGGAPGGPGVHPPIAPRNPYGEKNIPPRQTRTDVQPNTPQPYNTAQNDGGGAGAPAQPGNGTPAAPPVQDLSPDEQAVLIEAQRAQAQAANDPIQSILPPTSLGQQLNQQPEPTQSPEPSSNPTRQLPTGLQPKATGTGAILLPGQ